MRFGPPIIREILLNKIRVEQDIRFMFMRGTHGTRRDDGQVSQEQAKASTQPQEGAAMAEPELEGDHHAPDE